MKITVNVDCTPEEARAFFGLPDVKPMQDALLRQAQDRLSAAMAAMDPEAMMRAWLPPGMQSFDQFQKFWAQMAGAPPRKEP
ncbi:MAG: hypothetical protein H3C38_14825 [Rhodospirillales bacterium]|nr:hypothetical protein [Rhodospirillales bacterium]